MKIHLGRSFKGCTTRSHWLAPTLFSICIYFLVRERKLLISTSINICHLIYSKEFCQILYVTKESLYLNLCLWIVPAFFFFLQEYIWISQIFTYWENTFLCLTVLTLCILNKKKSLKNLHPITNKQKTPIRWRNHPEEKHLLSLPCSNPISPV